MGRSKGYRKKHGTKHRGRDTDQIHRDLANPPAHKIDDDLPGRGQFYCISCARYFITEDVLKKHCDSKQHKRRLKTALEAPWTQQDAEAAVGLTTE
ncbi:unnamed protein product [Vitrella brassicaformis CCMP3155]|uniref:C2H2-type domain-containing protein n=1 Tax=Vitrella brassicaformis (strain CCMP3155) TaxID=1169540 RepID=A0A0G4G2Q0_VITBC|nr:unnamed protein product [Vitrella brassicaformis CCMP3155]|mmetsp:Transcript_13105/g.37855  ORF Transcript_13105/g.37855 Transcript_13105/m.37855 type:complete len:96 (-) Transcript_13105:573-860(-)|eukprot:CEM22544.1 unnamed protein product [Vitrella brassicaformis CCMP3155]